jgi:hypothetical protein
MILKKSKKLFLQISSAKRKLDLQKKQQNKEIIKSLQKELFLADQILAKLKTTSDEETYSKIFLKLERLKKIIKKFA